MRSVGERPQFINPYQVKRTESTPDVALLLGKERLLIDRKFIVGFGHRENPETLEGDGVIAFITSDESIPIISEWTFTHWGDRASKRTIRGAVSTIDMHLPLPEKIFIANGEYEIHYKGRDRVRATVSVSSSHSFVYEKIWILRDADKYLKHVITHPQLKVHALATSPNLIFAK